jgi:hypothetical protein
LSWSNAVPLLVSSGTANINAKSLAVATDFDQHLALFYVGTNNGAYLVTQQGDDWSDEPSSVVTNWGTPTRLAGTATVKALAVARNGDGTLELFSIASDDYVYRMKQATSGSWSSPAWLAGAKAKAINVVAQHGGQLVVVTIGLDGVIRHQRQTAINGSSWTHANDARAERTSDGAHRDRESGWSSRSPVSKHRQPRLRHSPAPTERRLGSRGAALLTAAAPGSEEQLPGKQDADSGQRISLRSLLSMPKRFVSAWRVAHLSAADPVRVSAATSARRLAAIRR